MASHFHIPGSFEPHALTGVHPNVFRPPTSPSSSAYLSPGTPHHNHLPDPPAKRKRDDTRENTPTRDGAGRYVLAETPGAGLDDSVYSDVAYRRQLGPREEGGEGPGWKSTALGAIGGVVGKVWEFCKAGAFRGFYAGGGRGYAMGEGETPAGDDGTEKVSFGMGMGMSEDALGGFGMGRPEDTSGFSMENTAGPFDFARPEDGRRFRMERPEDSPRFNRPQLDTPPRPSPSQPSAKRRHLNDENWVLVDEPSRLPARRRNRNSSPNVTTGRRISTPVARLNTSYASYKAPTPRRSHRVSHAGSPALSPREPASFAATRSPVRSPTAADFASPSRIPLSSSRPRRSNSTLASPSSLPRPHRKTASLTEPPHHRPPSSSAPLPNGKTESPRLDPEARKLAARREREERDADIQMAAFNARLQDMIREGREALGTSFEVEVEGDGEGDGWMDE